jgi:hypothetical protein
MMVQAGAFPFCQSSAFAQGKELFNQGEGFIKGLNVREGAEVKAPVLHNVPGAEDPRERAGGDADHGVCFAVFQADVVLWAVLLYKGVFQKQSFVLIGKNDRFYRSAMLYQGRSFDIPGSAKV